MEERFDRQPQGVQERRDVQAILFLGWVRSVRSTGVNESRREDEEQDQHETETTENSSHRAVKSRMTPVSSSGKHILIH